MFLVDRSIARMHPDAIELLSHLGTTPVCGVTLAMQIGFDGQRFKEAMHAIRESGISLITCDLETICIARDSWVDANERATRYIDHLQGIQPQLRRAAKRPLVGRPASHQRP